MPQLSLQKYSKLKMTLISNLISEKMLTAHTDIAECQHPVFLTSFSR